MISAAFIRKCASEAGFSLCGIARSRPLHERQGDMERWLAAGMHSGLDYLERNFDKRFDPALLAPGTQSVVVCAVNYKNEAWDQRRSASGPRIASYAYAPDYHKTIKKMLRQLLAAIRTQYPQVGARAFTDSAPVLEKAWAVEAGLGWIGKNSLLVTPHYGTFVLLGELLLDSEVDTYDSPLEDSPMNDSSLNDSSLISE